MIILRKTRACQIPPKMYTVPMNIQDIRRKASPVLRSFGVARASVFGSAARGEAGPKSDIDLLIRFGRPIGMVDYMRFIGRMEEGLGSPVDIVTAKSALYLERIVDSIRKIESFTKGFDADNFGKDEKTRTFPPSRKRLRRSIK